MTFDPHHYVLDDNNVPQRASMMEAARFYRDVKRRRVGYDKVGGCLVSTVFLGLDHRYVSKGPPLLFETMIFDDDGKGASGVCQRYSTWDDAWLGHRAKVRKLKDLATKADALLEKVR